MKKLLTLALMLALVFALASCSMLPEDLQNTINGFLGVEPGEHTHEFVLDSTIKATCEEDGQEIYKCSCGAEDIKVLPAIGHNVTLASSTAPTCTRKGSDTYRCVNCGGMNETVEHAALGHDYTATDEPSRFAFCTRSGCDRVVNTLGKDGTYDEVLTFNFDSSNEEALDAKYNEILDILNNAAKYDPALHAYQEDGALADEYANVDALHTEFYELVLYAVAQRQIAEIDYYCDMKNTDLEDRYSYMMDYYTDMIAKFYSLSEPFYDSCYRDFFYYGMTEEEIKAYIFDSNALADPEYAALKSRNDEIELEFFGIANPTGSDKVPELYAEFVKNNNRMAEIMGYENYLEYAYENVYGRDYSYTDVTAIADYVSAYLGEAYGNYFSQYKKNYNNSLGGTDRSDYRSQVELSFFENMKSNVLVNDYVDRMSFTTNPDKQISFSDELNKLCSDGNLYRGNYEGAFVTYLDAFDVPVAYFSNGYDAPFTIVHEFGHYMNEIYNRSEFSQSYDLLEMHSQGNEMLYLSFIEGQITDKAYNYVEVDQITNMLNTVMASLAIDAFERAVYTDSYSGYNSAKIMADGTITPDEYDLLFTGALHDLGASNKVNGSYWRYGMTITSPCYYVSYAVSALSVLQLYEIAETEGFDAAAEAYLKLFTYTDVNPDFTDSEVLEYAGMYSVTDEQLYISLQEFFASNN